MTKGKTHTHKKTTTSYKYNKTSLYYSFIVLYLKPFFMQIFLVFFWSYTTAKVYYIVRQASLCQNQKSLPLLDECYTKLILPSRTCKDNPFLLFCVFFFCINKYGWRGENRLKWKNWNGSQICFLTKQENKIHVKLGYLL